MLQKMRQGCCDVAILSANECCCLPCARYTQTPIQRMFFSASGKNLKQNHFKYLNVQCFMKQIRELINWHSIFCSLLPQGKKIAIIVTYSSRCDLKGTTNRQANQSNISTQYLRTKLESTGCYASCVCTEPLFMLMCYRLHRVNFLQSLKTEKELQLHQREFSNTKRIGHLPNRS